MHILRGPTFYISNEPLQSYRRPLSVFVYACTKQNTSNKINMLSWAAYHGVLSVLPRPVCQRLIPETNTRHHASYALSRIRETLQMWYNMHLRATSTCNYTKKQCRVCRNWFQIVCVCMKLVTAFRKFSPLGDIRFMLMCLYTCMCSRTAYIGLAIEPPTRRRDRNFLLSLWLSLTNQL